MEDILECEGCIYATPTITADGEPIMKCRRYPPQIYLDGDGDVCQGFPDASKSCGEYKREVTPVLLEQPKPYGM